MATLREIMTDDEIPERDGNYLHGRTHGDRQCTAVLRLNGYTIRTCDAGPHRGPHRDPESGDVWEQHQEGSVQVSRHRYEELMAAERRLAALEATEVDNREPDTSVDDQHRVNHGG